ncbi:MAG: hypothetical protein H0W08_04060 [Acidobacteria bacterium]|nr:hypothetical protein [Acidobacteriota bacterium]
MPIRMGEPKAWQTIRLTADWQIMKTDRRKDTFDVATDLYYIKVAKQ